VRFLRGHARSRCGRFVHERAITVWETEILAALNRDLAEETKLACALIGSQLFTRFNCKGRGPSVLLGLWSQGLLDGGLWTDGVREIRKWFVKQETMGAFGRDSYSCRNISNLDSKKKCFRRRITLLRPFG
jgi:hypothetical protein